jgi:hypothetical protein
MRALAADPRDRFPTTEALGTALLEFARAADLDLSPLKLARLMRATFPQAAPARSGLQPAPDRTCAEIEPYIEEPSVIIDHAALSLGLTPTPAPSMPSRATSSPTPTWARTLAHFAPSVRAKLIGVGIALAAFALALVATVALPVRAPLIAKPPPVALARSTPRPRPRPTLPAWMYEPVSPKLLATPQLRKRSRTSR